MAEAGQVLPVGLTCETLLPGRVLEIVAAQIDQEAVRIRYRIVPPFPPAGPPAVHWRWSARDDVGTHYAEYGGAYGPSSDRRATQGVLSLVPAPPEAAETLSVELSPWISSEDEDRTFTFLVRLSARELGQSVRGVTNGRRSVSLTAPDANFLAYDQANRLKSATVGGTTPIYSWDGRATASAQRADDHALRLRRRPVAAGGLGRRLRKEQAILI